MPKGDKYVGLTSYLKHCGKDSITLSFSEIEGKMGDTLPSSAYKHKAFWSNSRTHSVAFGWLDADYRTVAINLENKVITFAKQEVPREVSSIGEETGLSEGDYDREHELRQKFNSFIQGLTGVSMDYYEKLSIEEFESLKGTLKDINNIITYQTTLEFVKWVKERFQLSKDDYQKVVTQVRKSKPNDNGYDIQLDIGTKIIAEVKCNRPINNGEKFGSAQKNGIIKDIEGLLGGKSKAKLNVKDYYKFLVLYDLGDVVKSATSHFLNNLDKRFNNRVRILKSGEAIDREHVFIVFIK